VNTNTAAADEEDEEDIILQGVCISRKEKMTIFCEGIKNDKRQVFLIMSLILYK